MKKVLILAAVFLALFQLSAFAQAGFKVGLVTDTGGIDDKSFNQGTWEGVVRFGKENKLKEGVDFKYLQSSAEADYVPNLSTFADEGMSLIIAPGFLFGNAITEVATKSPKVNFLIIDSVVADKTNVASAVFAEHEGSFLVGVAAGLKAKADKQNTVGFIGGIQFALIEKFEAGFRQGVKAVYPECKVLMDYAGDFAKPDIGQALAQKQYNAGAYIIFHAAGGTGNGLIKEAKERAAKGQMVWAIGVDKDQYADGVYATGKSAILTSMVKRVDVAAHDVAVLAKNGKFPGGQTILFNLKNDGVGLPAQNPNLSAAILKSVADYAAKIKAGTLVVSETPVR
jgi:basic membrane protein A and related proteins